MAYMGLFACDANSEDPNKKIKIITTNCLVAPIKPFTNISSIDLEFKLKKPNYPYKLLPMPNKTYNGELGYTMQVYSNSKLKCEQIGGKQGGSARKKKAT